MDSLGAGAEGGEAETAQGPSHFWVDFEFDLVGLGKYSVDMRRNGCIALSLLSVLFFAFEDYLAFT